MRAEDSASVRGELIAGIAKTDDVTGLTKALSPGALAAHSPQQSLFSFSDGTEFGAVLC